MVISLDVDLSALVRFDFAATNKSKTRQNPTRIPDEGDHAELSPLSWLREGIITGTTY